MTKKTDNLKIIAVQPDTIWQNAGGNLVKCTAMLSDIPDQFDLILLPEMFSTGFCTEPEKLAETMDGETIRWMKRTAESYKCAVAGSLIIRENKRYFNRLVFIDQYENFTWYDKRHLFTIGGEELKYTSGKERLVVPYKGWQICFQICYDLRFPVWSRNRHDYDVLVNLANWPEARSDVWKTLLTARAIENQCYVVGVNRVGKDGNGISYSGDSMAINPKGQIIGTIESYKENSAIFTLSWEDLNEFRVKFPVWKDWDEFQWQ